MPHGFLHAVFHSKCATFPGDQNIGGISLKPAICLVQPLKWAWLLPWFHDLNWGPGDGKDVV